MNKFLRYSFLTLLMAVVNFASAADKWVATAPANLQTGDVVVIVNQTNAYAMPNDKGTSSAPTATAVTLSADKSEIIVEPAANLQWTVTVNGESYQFATGDSYLYVTATNNGVRVGSGERNTFTIVTGGDNNGYYLYNEISTDKRWIGCYGTQDWRCYNTINTNIKGNNIAFYKKVSAEGKNDASVTVAATSIEVGETAAISFPEGLEIIFESDAESVATVDDNGVITGVGVGEATITAVWDANDEYNDGEAEFTITVTPATPADTYVKVTSTSQLVAGNEYILVASSGKAMGAQVTANNPYRSSVDVTIADDKVKITNQEVAVLTLGGKSGAWTVSTSEGYLSWNSGNTVTSVESASSNNAQWTVNDKFALVNVNTTSRVLQYNSSATRFACYTGSQADAVLFVKEGSAIGKTAVATINSITPEEVEVGTEGQFTVDYTLADGATATVAWSSDDENVVLVDEDGTYLAGDAAGTVNVTVTITPDDADSFDAVSLTKAVKVVDPNAPGTASNPFTVAQAIAYYDDADYSNTTEVYVKGIISKIDEVSVSNGNATYYISDDGTTASQLEVYRGKYLEGANFESEDQIATGDEVVVKGKLAIYHDIKEFAQGNELVSLTRGKEAAEIAFNPTTITITEGEDFEQPTFANPNNLDVTFESDNEEVAMWDEDNAELVLMDAIGTAVITATFAGNDSYLPATATLTVTVKQPAQKVKYGLVTSTDQITSGNYLIVYEGGDNALAFDGSLATLDANNNTKEVTVSKRVIEVEDPDIYFTIDAENGTLKSALGKYIGVSSNSNGLKTADDASTYTNSFSIDENGNAVITAVFDGSTMTLRFNKTTNASRFRYYKNAGQEAIRLYKEGLEPVFETATVTISESTYATFYYENKAFEIPEGVTASAVVKEGNSLTEIPVEGVIPAGCPVLLSGAQGEYEFVESAEAGNLPTANSLVGSEEGGKYDEAGYKYYVLCWKDKNKSAVGFYFLSGSKGAYATVKAHQAFLRVENAEASANGYALGFDETTGISTVEAAAADLSAPVYNLAGQRVNGSYKGVVIQNGVKRVNK